jgi:hypothetical protein
MNPPLVSVIMPVYNAAAYLPAAVGSILAQTVRDLELLVIDDGSSDDSLAVARRLAAADSRIRVEALPQNSGAASARNAGVAVARGRYLAFLDADDLALPHRLATQLAAIEHCSGSALACAATMLIDTSGVVTGSSAFHRPPEELAPTLLFTNLIVASTVLTPREGFPGFRPGYEPAEDYDAWLRALPGLEMIYHAEPLVQYRVHSAAVSARLAERMKIVRERIVSEALVRLGIEPAADDVPFHLSIADGTFAPNNATLCRAEAWLLRLREANHRTPLFPPESLARILSRYWSSVCNGCWQVPAEAVRRLAASPLAPPWRERWPLSARLRLRALTR